MEGATWIFSGIISVDGHWFCSLKYLMQDQLWAEDDGKSRHHRGYRRPSNRGASIKKRAVWYRPYDRCYFATRVGTARLITLSPWLPFDRRTKHDHIDPRSFPPGHLSSGKLIHGRLEQRTQIIIWACSSSQHKTNRPRIPNNLYLVYSKLSRGHNWHTKSSIHTYTYAAQKHWIPHNMKKKN